MFVATANVADPIPPPLRDRMEILEIPGYTRNEKLAIARQHLLPKQLDEHGIKGAARDHRPRPSRRSSTTTRARRASAASSARWRASSAASR
jgi:MoxR-like ATPase